MITLGIQNGYYSNDVLQYYNNERNFTTSAIKEGLGQETRNTTCKIIVDK